MQKVKGVLEVSEKVTIDPVLYFIWKVTVAPLVGKVVKKVRSGAFKVEPEFATVAVNVVAVAVQVDQERPVADAVHVAPVVMKAASPFAMVISTVSPVVMMFVCPVPADHVTVEVADVAVHRGTVVEYAAVADASLEHVNVGLEV
jgi:hypothetical protein